MAHLKKGFLSTNQEDQMDKIITKISKSWQDNETKKERKKER